jgi:ABC-type polar amino acid transport system ATPase subunit
MSLEVERGGIAALIGPSGGGKSTFLRCLNGLEAFSAGEVEIAGITLGPEVHPRRDAALLRSVRRKVGMVFQQFHLFPHRTVLENIIEAPMVVAKISREQAEAEAVVLLGRVGLEAKRDAWPRQLSGGQQQRVAIARALAMRPEVILFDEPTSALDPVMANEVLAVMGDLGLAGQTMIVVTHSMGFAEKVATTVHVMAEGTAVESGPPAQVFGAPQHHVTKAFFRAVERV